MFDQARVDEILGELRQLGFNLPVRDPVPGYPLLSFDLSEGREELLLYVDTDWCGEGESSTGKVFPMVNVEWPDPNRIHTSNSDIAEHDIWPNVHDIGPIADAPAEVIAEHTIAWAQTAVAWRGTLTR